MFLNLPLPVHKIFTKWRFFNYQNCVKIKQKVMNKLPIVFQLEEEIFYLFSFLNLIGYDQENNPEGMHPLRELIRQKLKNVLKINRYKLLKRYLSKKHQGQFVEWLLRKKYAKEEEQIDIFSKRDSSFFRKFDRVFQKFVSREKKILPWSMAKEFYAIEKKNRYRKIAKELKNLMKILNVDINLLGLKKIVVVPNFLDAYNRGYGPKIGKTAFIVYGPFKDDDFRLIRHELLHSVVKPLFLNNKVFLSKLKKLSKHNRLGVRLKKIGYSNWAVIIEEHLIRAIDIKTLDLGPKEKKKLLEQEKKKRVKYIAKIYAKLKKNYKRNELLDILKNILDNIQEIVR